MSKIPALGSTKDTQFLERVKEVLEVITGRRRTSTVSLGTVNGTTVDDFSLVDLCRFISGKTTKITAYLDTTQTISSAAAWELVELDATERDQLAEFNKTTHLATITQDGDYLLSCQVRFDTSADGIEYRATIEVNGTSICTGVACASGASQEPTPTTTKPVYLYSGDTVGLYAYCSSGTPDIASGKQRTYLCISRQI